MSEYHCDNGVETRPQGRQEGAGETVVVQLGTKVLQGLDDGRGRGHREGQRGA